MPKCVKNPCSICKFRVHNNHKAIFCNIYHLRVLKFGMTFLSDFVIHLIFLVTNINREIIFNHYKFKLS